MRHKHADLIHAWAEGAEIEYFSLQHHKWRVVDIPIWKDGFEYRIKPKEPEWWENIPKHGVLVKHKQSGLVSIVFNYTTMYGKDQWIPLTNEEIERFKR